MSSEQTKPRLLSLPLELRHHIYDYLIAWTTVKVPATKRCRIVSFAESGSHFPIYKPVYGADLKGRGQKIVYADSEIELPLNPILRIAKICRQIRTEFHDYASSCMARRKEPLFVDGKIAGSEHDPRWMHHLHDRPTLSTSFVMLTPYLSNIRHLSVEFWPGWLWWSGQGALAPKHAVDAMISRLPSIAKVEMVVLIHAWHFWNWDLPPVRYAQVLSFLDAPVRDSKGFPLQFLKRELRVPKDTEGAMADTPFYKKIETTAGPGQTRVHVVKETAMVIL